MAGPYKSLDDLDAAMSAKEQAKPYQSIGDLDAAISQSDANDQQRLGFSAKQSLTSNPEQYIKARDLGSQFGIPPDVAERNLPEVEYRNKLDALIGTMQKSPALGGLMQDPGYLKRTHDDIEALAQIEFETKGFRAASEFQRKALDAEMQGIFDRVMTGAKIEAEIERNRPRTVLDYVGQGGSALASSLWSANSGLWGLGRAAADVAGTVLPDETAKELSGFFTRYQQSTGKTAQEMLGDPNQQGFVERSVYSGLQSLGQNLLTLPAALIPGVGAGVALGPMTAMTGGTEYGKARDKGVAIPQALIYGASQAAIEYATEVMPVTKFLGDIKAGTPFASMLMKQVAYEVPGEQVATLLQDLNEWAVINPAKPFAAYLEERPSAAAQTLIATIVGVGGQATTVKGVETLVGAFTGQEQAFADPMLRKANASQRSLDAEAKLTQLVDAAGQSMSIARDPSAVQELVNAADEDGQTEIYINARQFANVFNQSPVETAAALGVTPEALNDALASNTDIVVPLSTFTTAVARDQALRPIIEHTRVDPGDMSPVEARLWQSQQGDQFKAEAEAVLAKRQADETFKAEVQQVHDNLLGQLNQAGRWAPQVNQKYAAMVRDFYVTMADRAGMTVGEMAAKYPLRVVAEGQGALQQPSQMDGWVTAPTGWQATHYIQKQDSGKFRVASNKNFNPVSPSFETEQEAEAWAVQEYGAAVTPAPTLQQSEQQRDLIVQHNLSADNLLHAVKMGGIPVPSLAITKKDHPLQGFGEITLLGSKDVADPKGYAGTKVFGADIYSPRYPTITFKLDSKALKKLNAMLAEYRKEGEREIYGGEISKVEDLTQTDVFRAYMLAKTGKTDIWDLRSGDKEAEASRMLAEVGAEEKLFKGYDYNGNRRYQPHTLENVVKILKKELRGGENFNYGVGSIRAKFTPQFRTIDQIRKAKNRLMDKAAFEQVKSEIDDEFNALSEALAPYHSHGNEFGFGDIMTQMMYDAAGMGISRSLRENQFQEVPAEIQQDIAEFLTKLRNLPTEYFEAKILRDVDLAEFSGAVVPEGVNPKVIEALQARGIKDIRTYKKGDQADRTAKIGEFENLFFQKQGDQARASFDPSTNTIALLEGADWSSFLHESGHFFLEVMADLASRPDAPASIRKDFETALAWMGVPFDPIGGRSGAAGDMGGTLEQPAYHGSPYKFDKFSLEHLGKGEGAQAYGWGLYFAGKKEIAEYYRNNLTRAKGADERIGAYKGQPVVSLRDLNGNITTDQVLAHAHQAYDMTGRSKDQRAGFAIRTLRNMDANATLEMEDAVDDAARSATDADFTYQKGGALYEVDIPEDGEYLLWDKPLSEQPENVKAAVQSVGSTNIRDALAGKSVAELIRWVDSFDRQNSYAEWAAEEPDVSADEMREQIIEGYGEDELNDYLGSSGFDPSRTGESIYREIASKQGNDEAASKYLNSLGIAGIKYLDGTSRDKGEGSFNYVIFDDSAVKVLQTYYQGGPETDPGAPTTPLGRTAAETWAMMSLDEKRPYHEKWARGFEAYLFEGKAPSVEMQGIFQRFSQWLKQVYTSLKALNVELTDDVRGVFDRMIASEDAIKTAEAVRNFAPIFQTAEQAGMTAEEWEQYQAEGRESTDTAVDELQARSIRDMRWQANAKAKKIKELQATAKELRAEVKIDVRREVLSQPLYRAWQFLTGKNPDQIAKVKEAKSDPNKVDPTKDTLLTAIAKLGGIDLDQAVSEWGLDPADANAKADNAVGGKRKVVRKEGGRKLDAMAEALAQYGYLETDATGKWDNRQFEEMFFDALRGGEYFSQYGEEAMIAAATRDAQGDPDAGITLENTPAGKLNTEMLKGMYGETDTAPWRLLSALRMTSPDGLAPDQVADLFGFTSGDDLVRRLAVAEDPKALIDQLTDQRMLELHGDLATPAEIELAAERAIHNDVRARVLTRELNALRKATGQGNVMLKAARMHADQWLARQTVRNATRHAQHVAAEGRAARASTEALKAGDTAAAAVHKRDQLLNNQLARGSIRAGEEVRRAVKYLKKFDKAGSRKAIDQDYLDQIDQLLERFDLRQVSGKALEKRASLAAWLKQQEEMGLDPVIDAALVEEAQRQHYSTLTLEEFRGLVDSIQSIEHLGRLKNRLLTAKDKREFKAVKDELVANIVANANRDVTTTNPITPLEKTAKLLRNFSAMHRKFASIIREMDGGQDGGKMWEYLVRTMNDAGDAEVEMRGQMSEKFANLFSGLKGIKLNEKVYIPALKISLRREELLSVALNSGNEGNVQRLLDGGINESLRAITYRQLFDVLNMVTPQEWDFVEGVWAMIEANRPAIAAQEKALTGVEPKWVEPTPFTLASGRVIRGGYYPAKYNADMSTRSNELEAVTDLRQQMMGAGGRAATRKSYTEARAAEVSGRPMRLDLGVIAQHINEVTHRLAWQEWLIDARRILHAPDIDRAIRDHYGPEILAQLKKQLVDIAAGDNGPTDAMDRVMAHLRNGTTIAGMGWNIMTSLMQPIGLTQSAERIGVQWLAKGLAEYMRGNPFKVTADVHERSSFMANRAKTLNREINDVLNQIKSERMSQVEASYFYLIQKFQQMVDVPTWLGAYEKAIADGNADDRAVALADQAVIDSQGAGQLKDLAAIQRGSAGQKLFTAFYSFFSTTYQRAVENYRATDFKNPTQVGKLAANYLLLFTLPAVWGWALKEALRGDDDDEDAAKIAKRLAMEQINYLLGTMVLVREIGSTISGFSGYQGPAGTRFFAEMGKFVKQATQGDVDMALVKAAANTVGVAAHLPTGQVMKSVEGTVAVMDGKAGPQAILVGPPLKN